MAAYDVVIVGGGPGGLNAALYLGRGRKKVLLCDAGTPRNAAAEHMHGFGSRDGIPPPEFRRISREQLKAYPNVEVRDTRVGSVEKHEGGFRVALGDGTSVDARRLLLAMGVVDVMMDIPGYKELWGPSIFQCPYCHGWEVQDQPFAMLAKNPQYLDGAPIIQNWSRDLIVFTHGAFEVSPEQREKLQALGIPLEERKIRALHGKDGRLAEVELEDGTRIARSVMFSAPPQKQHELVTRLGLELDDLGYVKASPTGETSVPGVVAVGDMTTPMQAAIAAASAGTIAAAMMNHALILEDADRRFTEVTGKPAPSRQKAH
ncbi:NAD(P)/FAD-dependent oxidoreductase [Corallococcus sp. AB018]|uniref:NAD(P)/FAD-dependent oxidoreductase n=1 Tax=Corallococcus TaxID=83461 RepID=UPI000F88EB64|nr:MULTISPECIES: NAD(P)/FAD-dependent oxidoreductase [Corallococcus]NNB91659.1 NAD(P)/FAD-dependent oxidoreductase [Corallococcus exiguus]NPD29605.1 NAD(P)/FAD-dependent oxidoreductase [Corallococcus exiguus]NRD48938.1 NAD(P)/FAD-dependent oxidoreductase [Corallococcus exiguus]RUO87487.1 NAD(P)/FAD-dependent oxidoreductase [Corallococcus sp. AB018]